MDTPTAIINALFEITYHLLGLYIDILILGAILSWLVAFNIINSHNRFVQTVGDFIYRITEPLLRPIRRVVPPMNGLDLSPLILIVIIWFIQIIFRNKGF
jgi:YggT family protein